MFGVLLLLLSFVYRYGVGAVLAGAQYDLPNPPQDLE